MTQINIKGISTLIGVFILHSIIGTIHTFPSLSKYFFSYLIELNKETFTHTTIEISLYLLNLTHHLSFPVGVYLVKYINSSIIIGISLLFKLGMNSIYIFFPDFNLVMIALFIESIASGLSYIPGLLCVWKYFPNYKGFVTGIAMSGFGVTRMMYKYISIFLINPNDIPPLPMRDRYPKEINENFKLFLKESVIFFSIISILSIFLIYPYGAQKEEEKSKLIVLKKTKSSEKLSKVFKKRKIHSYSLSNLKSGVSDEDNLVTFLSSYIKDESDSSSDNEKKTGIKNKKNESISSLITSQPFLQLTFIFFFSMMFCSIELFIIKKLGKMHRHSEETISNGTLLWKIVNAFCFPLWGYLIDKFKFKNLFIGILIIEISVSSCCYFICSYKWGYLLYTFLGAIVNSANLAISPAVYAIIFGSERGAFLFSISSNLFNTYYFLRPFINNFVTVRIYYLFFYLIITFSAVLSLIILCFFVEKPYIDKETNNLPYMELDEFDATDTDV